MSPRRRARSSVAAGIGGFSDTIFTGTTPISPAWDRVRIDIDGPAVPGYNRLDTTEWHKDRFQCGSQARGRVGNDDDGLDQLPLMPARKSARSALAATMWAG